MSSDLDRVFQGLEEARAFAAAYRFEITPEYRALIARVEALPQNQSGADKSGPWRGSLADWQAWRARVIPLAQTR
jgi:hypothetical protein